MPSRTKIAALMVASSMSAAASAHAQTPASFLAPAEYTQTNLVSSVAGQAVTTDPNLLNAWGVAFEPNGPFWVDSTGAGLSLLYDGTGAKVPANFVVPTPPGVTGPSSPTGIVWNATSGFAVPGTSLKSAFIFSTLNGTISAWAPSLPTNPLDAVLAVDNSKTGASYAGLELAATPKGAFIYAPNIATGHIDVFDSTFKPASGELAGRFVDPAIPAGYTPFNLREINGTLVVVYAKQNAAKTFVTPGVGLGYVAIFDNEGRLLKNVASGGLLNAPWGIAEAPVGFGAFSNRLLIGNFGDGHILGYIHGVPFPLPLLDKAGAPIQIPGLWELTFGGAAKSDTQTLYFSAGPDRGQAGLFGSLSAVQPSGY